MLEAPTARARDPSTSHDAGEAHRDSGARANEQRIVAAALRRYGGSGITSDELAVAAGLDRYMVARRLPELRDARPASAWVHGYPELPEKRVSGISGRRAMVWRPAPAEPEQRPLGL